MMLGHKILIVDDEVNILRSLKRLLDEEDFQVIATDSPVEALDLLGQLSFAVIVSDQRMPDMTGLELLQKAKTLSPNTIRIILTAHAELSTAMEAINTGAVFKFLSKPWNDEDLCSSIREAIAQHELLTKGKEAELEQEQEHAAPSSDQASILKDLNRNLTKRVVERLQEIHQLNQDLKTSNHSAIQALANIVKTFNTKIWHHSIRISTLAKAMGKKSGLAGNQLYCLEVAALLHDIGKIGIPPHILTKQEEALTPDELAMLNSHGVHGEAIVKMVPNMESSALFIRHHHEKFDGTGYPDKLFGTVIPLESRIIAIANTFDKYLHQKKPSGPITPIEAIEYIEQLGGKALDPELVLELRSCVLEPKESEAAPEPNDLLTWEDVLSGYANTHTEEEAESAPEEAKGENAPLTDEEAQKPLAIADTPTQKAALSGKPASSQEPSNWTGGAELSPEKIAYLIRSGEVRVKVIYMGAGMILSRHLMTRKSAILLSKNTIVTQRLLEKLRLYIENNYIVDDAYVYKKSFYPSGKN